MSSSRKGEQSVAAGVIEPKACLYGWGYPAGCCDLLGPQLLAVHQAHPQSCKKTWADDKKSESWHSKRADRANLGS